MRYLCTHACTTSELEKSTVTYIADDAENQKHSADGTAVHDEYQLFLSARSRGEQSGFGQNANDFNRYRLSQTNRLPQSDCKKYEGNNNVMIMRF